MDQSPPQGGEIRLKASRLERSHSVVGEFTAANFVTFQSRSVLQSFERGQRHERDKSNVFQTLEICMGFKIVLKWTMNEICQG